MSWSQMCWNVAVGKHELRPDKSVCKKVHILYWNTDTQMDVFFLKKTFMLKAPQLQIQTTTLFNHDLKHLTLKEKNPFF